MKKDMQIEEILKHCEAASLHQFIIEYADKDQEFKKGLIARLGPQKISKTREDYINIILAAFSSNSMKSGSRYREWDDYGFDAVGVAADLQPLLEKVDYCVQHKNYDEAILVCEALIETIPDEWMRTLIMTVTYR